MFLAGGPDGLSGMGARSFDGDGRADLVVTAPGGDTADGVAHLLRRRRAVHRGCHPAVRGRLRRHGGAGAADGRRRGRPSGRAESVGLRALRCSI
nr:FG-GAP repeat protein [Streptomyces flaveolus]